MGVRGWFIVGTLPMIGVGGLHLLLVLVDELRPTFLTPADEELRPRLEATTIKFRLLFPGGREDPQSMWRAWLGFNLSHGLGLLTIGLLLLSLALHDFSIVREIAMVQPLTIAWSASYLAASLRYWFYAPSIVFAGSLIGFIVSASLA